MKLNYLIKELCTIKYLNITAVARVLGKVLDSGSSFFPPSSILYDDSTFSLKVQ